MSKFKVGDKVEYTGTISPDFIGKQGVITKLNHLFHWVDFGISGAKWVSHESIALVNPSPIRTVTTTEIVAGKYGRIEIEAVTGLIIMRIIDPLRFHTAEDLRESGELLLKLADALDNGAKVVSK